MGTTTDISFATEEERWAALMRRDRRTDGVFWYGVQTTGVYCRPTCPSRLPNRTNVRFFEAPEDAERAGFRACKRCNPRAPNVNGPHTDAIIRACQLIDTAGRSVPLKELADTAGLSPSHFHRLFRATIGVTPKQYAMTRRMHRVQDCLQQDATVTDAMYNAGFVSSSRFYENGTHTLGMTPSTYRTGAQGVHIRFAVVPCYLGWVLVAATERGICAIEFGDSPESLTARVRARFPQADLQNADASFENVVARVVAFIEAPQQGLDLPLDIQGTGFQRRVWTALREIPVGSTASYAEIAARIGQPSAARAVARACATNPVALAIPCHRVVREDGKLGGYRWGLERKQALLEREAQARGDEGS